ncbi:hypothetical protein [Paracoccus ravus]|uniref:hypothetical protein n=1 Tax=Paracoccus ravus TaxID=2447760 RepID=UPI00106E2013|nr:hypothetical protein [Paracoccus ravus]
MAYARLSKIAAIGALATLAACAEKSDQIPPAFVSPSLYHTMNCGQLTFEAQSVLNRANQAAVAQDKKASNDAVATGVGVVLFWPALFMIKGDGAQAAELARLKGEIIAIQQAGNQKNCGIRVQ